MAISQDGINIGTISGGIVNFGGAVYISPISVTKTVAGSGEGNETTTTTTNSLQSATDTAVNLASKLLNTIRRSR
jgi:Spore germination protein gerPA/gerPF